MDAKGAEALRQRIELEERRRKAREADEAPYRAAGHPAGPVSMGGGRKLEPYGSCPKSPDGKHHYTAVSCIQSNEHFVCDYCEDSYWD